VQDRGEVDVDLIGGVLLLGEFVGNGLQMRVMRSRSLC
jgi:hypothetical protein